MATLGNPVWTSSNPDIYLSYAYEYQRSGSSMQYRFTTVVEMEASGTFGFPIYQTITLNGTIVDSGHIIKNASPSKWSSYTYQTGWFTVANKVSGTVPVTFRVYSGSGSSRDQYDSYNLSVSPAASVITSFPSFDIGKPFYLYITKYATGFTDALSLKINGVQVLSRSNVNSGAAITPTAGEIEAMYAACPNTANPTASVTITTQNGSTTIGSATKTANARVVDSAPLFTGFIYHDINADTIRLSGDDQIIVSGYSRLEIRPNPAKARNGASLTSYIAQVGQARVEVNPDSLYITLANVTGGEIRVAAKDSRGFITEVVKTAVCIDYSSVSINEVSFKRDNDMDTKTKMYLRGGFVGAGNSIERLSYRYKSTASSVWSSPLTLTPTLRTGVYTFHDYIEGDLGANGFDVATSYDVEITAKDKLTEVSRRAVLPTGTPGIYLQKQNGHYAIGIGKKPEISYGIDIDGEVKLNHSPVVTQATLARSIAQNSLNLQAEGALAEKTKTENTVLWQGKWEDGGISAPFDQYQVLAVIPAEEQAPVLSVCRIADSFEGSGCQIEAQGISFYHIKAQKIQGEWQLLAANKLRYPHLPEASPVQTEKFAVGQIYALQ